MKKTIRIAARVLAALALAYAAVLVWFYFNQDAILFHPDRRKLTPAPVRLNLDSKDVSLSTADGIRLVARLIPPPPEVSAADAAWILYFHGSGGNVGAAGYNAAWAEFRRLGLGVLAVDYRGFGESEGVPSEGGLYRDADAAYHYLTTALRISPARIIIYGYSLGSAVAIDLAARVPAAGMIVEGAFLSVPERGAELYPFLPVRAMARNRFASVDKVALIGMPQLFIHAGLDQVVPVAHGRRLFDRARPPKFFQEVGGGHADAFKVDRQFFAAVARFIGTLGLPLREIAPLPPSPSTSPLPSPALPLPAPEPGSAGGR